VAPARYSPGSKRAAAGQLQEKVAAAGTAAVAAKAAALVSAERLAAGARCMGKGLSQGYRSTKAQPSYQHDRTDCRLAPRPGSLTTELLHGLSIT